MNFTFRNRFGFVVGVLLVALFGMSQAAFSQCPTPTGLTVLNIGQNTAQLRWTSNSTPADNSWTITVGGSGITGCDASGQAIINTTVSYPGSVATFSAPVTAMTVVGTQITVTVSGLNAGTLYQFFVSETCNDAVNPPAVSACAGPAAFQTLDNQYTVSATAVRPSCPFNSPGYAPNGSFTVTVTNGSSCAGTYTVNATPVAGSGPNGSTPPQTTVTTYIGFPAGSFFFGNAGAGNYTVTVTETGTCNPPTDPVVLVVTVPNGIDNVAPVFYLTDLLGNVIVDTDGTTPTPASLNLGNVTIPEGACGRQDQFFVFGIDNCDEFIIAANAVSASAVTTPATIVPGTQVSTPATPDGAGFYLVDVYWSTGSTVLTVTGRDASANTAVMTLTANVIDNTDPVVSFAGNSQFVIPVCQTNVTGFFTVQVSDGCDQSINFANLVFNTGGATAVINFTGENYREFLVTFPSPGNYLLSASYTDFNGNVGFIDQVVSVVSAAVNQAPDIIATAANATITACNTTATVPYAFTVSDDCEAIVAADVRFRVLANGTTTVVDVPGTALTSQACGSFCRNFSTSLTGIPAGNHIIRIDYQGQTVDVALVVTQNANQPADIVMPSVNVTIPQCQASVAAAFSVTILDDCDNPIVPARASFSLGGTPLTPSFVNAAAGFFEFVVNLTAANNGNLLLATYTDAQGAVRTVDALITVNAQPDLFAPIIVYPSQDINIELDPCGPSVGITFFEVSAYDNCPGNVNLTVAIVSNSPGSVGEILEFVSPGGNTFAFAGTPGAYQIGITATDAAGNTRVEDFFIIINQEDAPATNLACIGSINVTLNSQCSVEITPEMVLSGNFGCVDPADLTVVINNNPAQGPFINECGTFEYKVLQEGTIETTTLGFTGAFAAGNWFTFENVVDPGIVERTVSFTSNTMTLTTFIAPGFFVAGGFDAVASIAVPSAGNVSFNYNYNGADPGFDFFRFGIGPNGLTFAPLQLNLTNPAQGTFTTPVAANQFIIFNVRNDGFAAVAPNQNTPSVAVITNFRFDGQEPAQLPLCWGFVNAEDKTPPRITCLESAVDCTDDIFALVGGTNRELTTALANQLTGLGIALPEVSDNCGVASVMVRSSQISSTDVCANRFYNLTFTVTDNCGNTASCVSRVNVGRDDLSTICGNLRNYDGLATEASLPAISCTDPRLVIGNPSLDANGNPLPSWTGAPTNQSCNIQCAYNDINIPLCGVTVNPAANPRAARKILRTWTCIDWCIGGTTGAQVQECTQVIKIKDDIAPEVRPLDYALKVMDNNTCEYRLVLREPTVIEGCSDVVSVTVSVNGGPFQPFVNGFFPSQTLQPVSARQIRVPVGTLTLVYRAVDQCGNVGEATVVDELEDKTPPIAICETFRVASLGADCRVRIFAEAFDDGSYDNCSEIDMHVRRMPILNANGTYNFAAMPGIACYEGNTNLQRADNYATFREWVDFCCADFSTAQTARVVEFRVTDASGNRNTCMVNVEVQDKIAPTGVRPADLTIDCNDPVMHWNWANDGLTAAQRAEADEFFGTVVVEDPHTIPSARRNVSILAGNPRIVAIQSGVTLLDGRAWDNCGGTACFSAESRTDFDASDCRTGVITRTWTYRDAGGNTLTLRQFITVVNSWPFMAGPQRATGTSQANNAFNATGYYTTFRQANNPGLDPRQWSLFLPTSPNAGFQNPFSEAGAFRSHFRQAAVGQPGNTATATAMNGYATRFDVVWPADLEINVCGQGITPDALAESAAYRSGARPYIWREDICSQVGVAYDEWVFDFEAGCKKVLRKWKLIDWCQQQSVFNMWTWDQTIKIIDTVGPEFGLIAANGTENGDVEVSCGASVIFPFLDACDNPAAKPVSFIARAKDLCAIESEVDAIRWDWEVYPFGDRTSPIRRSSFPGQNFIPRGDSVVVNRAFPRTLPGGPGHVIKFIAEDGCGNKSTCEVTFRIEDRKKPTPICFSALSTDVMPAGPMAGSVSIAATLFNNNSNDNCEVNRFRLGQFTEPGQDSYTGGPRHLRTPLNTHEALIFTCKCPDVLPAGVADCDALRAPNASNIRLVSAGEGIPVVLWVGDIYGNWDYCNAVIRVDNNMGADCDDPSFNGAVAGLIKTEVNEGVEFADVDVMVSGFAIAYNGTTNVQGNFMVTGVPHNNTYTVSPSRNDSPRNGVNVADILAIQRHILGSTRLDSPYKLIAADVNKSGTITATDLVEVRRVLLNDVGFSNNTSWRFVAEAHEFTNEQNAHAESFPESITINLEEDRMNENFVGIKVGDVNNSVRANSQSLQGATSRSRGMEIVANEMSLKAGNTYTVDFRSSDIANVEGYQFTFSFNTSKVAFQGYTAKGLELGDDNFGFSMLEEGLLTTAWTTLEGVNLGGNDAMFSLTFRAIEDAMLSEVLTANSAFTEALAISNNTEIGLNLVFETKGGVVASEVYELYQNKPNPFANETIIGFTLPQAMNATITVFDVTGKVVKFIDGDFAKGLNNVIIKKSDLPASGVMYYQLEAGDFRATKKMIIIE